MRGKRLGEIKLSILKTLEFKWPNMAYTSTLLSEAHCGMENLRIALRLLGKEDKIEMYVTTNKYGMKSRLWRLKDG